MLRIISFIYILLLGKFSSLSFAWQIAKGSSSSINTSKYRTTTTRLASKNNEKEYVTKQRMVSMDEDNDILSQGPRSRRNVFKKLTTLSQSLLVLDFAIDNSQASAEVQRAVGSAEIACREAGNCLETGQWDGAVGWNWGGKDRCDASDPRCGPDGILLDDVPTGKPIPDVTGATKITHLAEIQIDIGKAETGTIRLGLYGDDCPGSVAQILKFLSPGGLATTSSLVFENGMGITSEPLSLTQGGVVPNIVPGKIIDFGIPSQSAAYARARNTYKAKENFIPQPRPPPSDTKDDKFVSKHDAAGLLSVPVKGLGYGGSGFESEDEAFESTFQITADAVPSMDKNGRRVIGQVVDKESMAFLARLASLPTKKGLKGVIPGQTSGPPLLRVTVRNVRLAKV